MQRQRLLSIFYMKVELNLPVTTESILSERATEELSRMMQRLSTDLDLNLLKNQCGNKACQNTSGEKICGYVSTPDVSMTGMFDIFSNEKDIGSLATEVVMPTPSFLHDFFQEHGLNTSKKQSVYQVNVQSRLVRGLAGMYVPKVRRTFFFPAHIADMSRDGGLTKEQHQNFQDGILANEMMHAELDRLLLNPKGIPDFEESKLTLKQKVESQQYVIMLDLGATAQQAEIARQQLIHRHGVPADVLNKGIVTHQKNELMSDFSSLQVSPLTEISRILYNALYANYLGNPYAGYKKTGDLMLKTVSPFLDEHGVLVADEETVVTAVQNAYRHEADAIIQEWKSIQQHSDSVYNNAFGSYQHLAQVQVPKKA